MRAWLAIALVCACEPKKSDGPPTKVGELGAARFTYVCGPDSDPQCNMDAELAPKAASSQFPQIASGARFRITATRNAEAGVGGPLDVTLASSAIVDTDPTSTLFVAKRPGWASLVAKDGASSVDITSVLVAQADHLDILQATPDGKFLGGSVQVGAGGVSAQANVQYTFRFRALPVTSAGVILAGALPCQWTSSDPNVAKLTSPPQNNIAIVVSGAVGKATIDVTLGALKGSVVIEVK